MMNSVLSSARTTSGLLLVAVDAIVYLTESHRSEPL
jgi:hypothetical protein